MTIVSVLSVGCSDTIGNLTSMTAVKTDLDLPTVKNVKTIVDKTSVGFEWPAITDKRVEGIDIYRGVPSKGDQKLEKIATIGNRFATHYVDTTVQPNRTYLYSFRTFGILFGSAPGQVVRVKTAPPLAAVHVAKVYQPAPGVVKLLWAPHPDPRIVDYLIERRLGNGEWKYLATVKGRLNPEYIDMSPAVGHRYGYRVIARTYEKMRALPSKTAELSVR